MSDRIFFLEGVQCTAMRVALVVTCMSSAGDRVSQAYLNNVIQCAPSDMSIFIVTSFDFVPQVRDRADNLYTISVEGRPCVSFLNLLRAVDDTGVLDAFDYVITQHHRCLIAPNYVAHLEHVYAWQSPWRMIRYPITVTRFKVAGKKVLRDFTRIVPMGDLRATLRHNWKSPEKDGYEYNGTAWRPEYLRSCLRAATYDGNEEWRAEASLFAHVTDTDHIDLKRSAITHTYDDVYTRIDDTLISFAVRR